MEVSVYIIVSGEFYTVVVYDNYQYLVRNDKFTSIENNVGRVNIAYLRENVE